MVNSEATRGDLPADAIAEVAKQRGADRPGDERAMAKGGQRLQGGRSGIALREKDMREDDDRGGGIDVEVEKLNGGANERGRQQPCCVS